MSEVWRGYDKVLGRAVAVKRLPLRQVADRASNDRVRAEARSAAQLTHPNVASVYDFGLFWAPSGRRAPYIVMELVEGATLAEHLRSGPMDWRIAVRVCAEVSAALVDAHSRGIIHRDVKPANIMLTPSGAKVLDFGIAAGVGERDTRPDGVMLGTPAYVAPERLAGEAAAPATDMYAVGVLLYHCLTGRLPWLAGTETQMLYSHQHLDPDPLPPIPGLAPEVADLAARCLSKDAQQRPTSLVAALILAEAVDARVYVPPVSPEIHDAGPPGPPEPADPPDPDVGEHARHRPTVPAQLNRVTPAHVPAPGRHRRP